MRLASIDMAWRWRSRRRSGHRPCCSLKRTLAAPKCPPVTACVAEQEVEGRSTINRLHPYYYYGWDSASLSSRSKCGPRRRPRTVGQVSGKCSPRWYVAIRPESAPVSWMSTRTRKLSESATSSGWPPYRAWLMSAIAAQYASHPSSQLPSCEQTGPTTSCEDLAWPRARRARSGGKV